MRAPDTSEILLQGEGESTAFGGVKALTDVSFDIMKGEIRAIIGRNGAGKTSMLNVINGFYHPDHGALPFKGRTRARMQPFEASRGAIALTFQNVALFKGMSALDNIMAGRTLRMRRGLFWQMLRYGPALAGEIEARHRGAGEHAFFGRCCATALRWRRKSSIGTGSRRSSIFWRLRRSARCRLRVCHMACRNASNSAAPLRWSRICFSSTS